MQTRSAARRFIFGSAFIGSIGTFGMHVLLPALPAIASAMQVGPGTAQLLISLSLLAIAFGNLFVAPLSDRFGRRPTVLAGLALFLAGSVGGLLAPDIGTLVAARVLQAFGGGAAMAIIRVTVTEQFGPAHAVGALATMATAILVVPMIAPTLGGFAVDWLGWRAAFGLAALAAVVILTFALRRLQETRPAGLPAGPAPRTLSSYAQLLRSADFMLYVAFGASMMGAVYTFVAGAPYAAIGVLGVSPSAFGLLLFLPAVASFAGFWVTARYASRLRGLELMQRGALLACTGSALITGAALAGLLHPLALFLPGMLIGFGNALSAPYTITGAITQKPGIAGAASGLLGFLQLIVAAAATQLVAELSGSTPLPLGAVLLGLGLVSLIALRAIARRRAQAGR